MKKKGKIEKKVFSADELRKELIHSAKALGESEAVAEIIAEKVSAKVAERIARHSTITEGDLKKFVAEEAKKYNKDLAYVYKNRGTII